MSNIKEKLEEELARLQEGLPQMLQQRDQMTQQILRIEGALMTLRAMLAEDKPADVAAAATLYDAGIEAVQEE